MEAKFYSEYGEDKWIAENLYLPALGYYVDVGCFDPVFNSNTAFLRDRGWNGLAIDGNFDLLAERWRDVKGARFMGAVIGGKTGGEVLFDVRENAATSRVTNALTPRSEHRYSVRLLNVLRRANVLTPVDFLSIDIEGSEFDAFDTSLLVVYTPRIIVAEYNTEGLGEDFHLRDFLVAHNYEVVHKTVANLVYVRKV